MRYLLLTIVVLAGCAATPRQPAEQILGSWQSTVGAFTYRASYSAEAVSIDGHEAVGYVLDGDQLTVAGDAVMTRTVSFPNADTMEQFDPVTGTRHVFTRVTE